MEALKMTRVCRGYDGGDVLTNLDFSLAEGAFEALMGPSGCGKSTFLHIAAGLISASSGTVSIGGNDITTMNDSMLSRFRRRHVGVVFQDFNLLPGKTVRDNVLLPLRLDGVAISPEIESRFVALTEKLGIAGAAAKKAGLLSGGERQRAALARALVTDPDLVLADEPTGNIDPKMSLEIMDLLVRIHRRGKTVIVVTHEKNIVDHFQKRVITIRDGHVVDDRIGGMFDDENV